MFNPESIPFTRDDAESFFKRKYVDLLKLAAIIFIASLCPTVLAFAGAVCAVAGLVGAFLASRPANKESDNDDKNILNTAGIRRIYEEPCFISLSGGCARDGRLSENTSYCPTFRRGQRYEPDIISSN
jgi:hypothetical protein